MGSFKYLDHTADVAILAQGDDRGSALASLAQGMFALIVDLEEIRERDSLEVQVEAPDQEALVVEWLSQLLFPHETERWLFSRFQVEEMGETALRAVCFGEQIDEEYHQVKLIIKGPTYHMLKMEEGNGCTIQAVLDI